MENIQKCEAEYLITKLNFPRLKKCPRKAKVVRDGVHYCGIHDPVHMAERRETLEKQKDSRREARFKLHVAYLRAKQKAEANNG